MKNFILFLFLAICLHLMNTSLQTYYSIHKFSSNEVKVDIEYLSSNVFRGRLAGTRENKMVAQYIESRFKKAGLLPYEGSYTQTFSTRYPERLENSPYLRSVDKNGKTVVEYKYGVDFKEDMLNFRSNLVRFDKSNYPQFGAYSIQVIKDSHPYIFYIPDSDSLAFRSSFSSDSIYDMFTIVTKSTFNSIRDELKRGNSIECYAPYEVKNTELKNIMGFLKGRDSSKPPIIISAHFDHIGSDTNSNIYNGALDNASGMSFVLQMINYVKSLGIPERDIIFVGFNAEEFGLLGSSAFVEKYGINFKGSKVYNFDMIGSNNDVPLSIMGSKTDSSKTPFIESVSTTCINEKISYNFIFEDASDHDPFRKHDIDAITLSDSDMSRIHTPEDKADYIDTANIDRAYKIISKEVVKNAYNNNFVLIYYKQVLLTSTLGAMLIIMLSTLGNKENLNS